jgi:hypothetical protein
MGESLSDRRMAENEVVFREANERVQQGLQKLHEKAKTEGFDDIYDKGEPETPLHFYCECADEKCRKRVVLLPSMYRQLHTSKTRFIILPGHETPSIERVIKREKDYMIVDKFVTPPDNATDLHPTDLEHSKE